MKIPAIFNWSGGKDSSLALYRVLQAKQYDVQYLLTTVNAENERISMHGVRLNLLEKQAEEIGIPLKVLRLAPSISHTEYNRLMTETLTAFKKQGISHSIFGDIFLEDLRAFRDAKLADVGFTGVYPVWGMNTTDLVNEFIQLKFKTRLVCINAQLLPEKFCGRIIDNEFLADLPANVDPAGENGEFHTFVFDGPIFKQSIPIELGEKVEKTYTNPENSEKDICFLFQDLIPKLK